MPSLSCLLIFHTISFNIGIDTYGNYMLFKVLFTFLIYFLAIKLISV